MQGSVEDGEGNFGLGKEYDDRRLTERSKKDIRNVFLMSFLELSRYRSFLLFLVQRSTISNALCVMLYSLSSIFTP